MEKYGEENLPFPRRLRPDGEIPHGKKRPDLGLWDYRSDIVQLLNQNLPWTHTFVNVPANRCSPTRGHR